MLLLNRGSVKKNSPQNHDFQPPSRTSPCRFSTHMRSARQAIVNARAIAHERLVANALAGHNAVKMTKALAGPGPARRAEASTSHERWCHDGPRAHASSPETSAVVGTSAGKDALDDDRPRGDVELNDHAPIADRRRDSARPFSLRTSALRGSSASRPIALSTRCLTCGSSRSRSLSARRSNSTAHGSAVTNRRACA